MKTKMWRIAKIVLQVLMYVVLAFALFAVIVATQSKKDADGAATVFGYQLRIVQSGSMEKNEATPTDGFEIKDLPVKTLLFIQTVPEDEQGKQDFYKSLKIGDVLTFRYRIGGGAQVTITHRIVDIYENHNGGYTISLRGDNQMGAQQSNTGGEQTIYTEQDTFDYVIGKVVGHSYPLGLLLYALKTPVGIVCIVIIPCVIIIIMEIIKIVNAFSGERRAKEKKEREEERARLEEEREKERLEKEARESELEALKKRLAALEMAANGGAGTDLTPQTDKKE